MTVNVQEVGLRLRQLRQAKQWSLAECATHTGVSKAMLGQIERQESSPTLATLWKLATGLKVSLSALLLTTPEPAQQVFTCDGIHIDTLLPFDSTSRQETYRLTLEPGSNSRSEPHQAGTRETVYVVSGELSITLISATKAEESHRIQAGEAFSFDAAQVHCYSNTGSINTEFVDVISYF